MVKKAKARLVLVDDRPEAIQAFMTLLEIDGQFQLDRAFTDTQEAIPYIVEARPDAVLLDIVFPGPGGVEALRTLRAAAPELTIVMLTAYDNTDYLFESLLAGANGYILKSDPPEEIVAGIGNVLSGGVPMSRAVARRVLQFFHRVGTERLDCDELNELSPRETEILHLIAKGYLAKEVADRLGITFATVRTHLKRIYGKLHVHSASGAIAKLLTSKSMIAELFQ